MVNLALKIKPPLLLSSSIETVNGHVKPWGRDARVRAAILFFFLAVFFRATHDGVSERGAARSLGGPR